MLINDFVMGCKPHPKISFANSMQIIAFGVKISEFIRGFITRKPFLGVSPKPAAAVHLLLPRRNPAYDNSGRARIAGQQSVARRLDGTDNGRDPSGSVPLDATSAH
jgi:hypothetical protein